MRAISTHNLDSARMWIEFLRTYTDKPIYELLPPPPIDLERLIMDGAIAPSREHAARAGEVGFCPPVLRRKLWKLYAAETQRICEQSGIFWIAPPNACMDENGALLRSFSAGDPIHANDEYGGKVLYDLNQLLRYHRSENRIAM